MCEFWNPRGEWGTSASGAPGTPLVPAAMAAEVGRSVPIRGDGTKPSIAPKQFNPVNEFGHSISRNNYARSQKTAALTTCTLNGRMPLDPTLASGKCAAAPKYGKASLNGISHEARQLGHPKCSITPRQVVPFKTTLRYYGVHFGVHRHKYLDR
jgi:hypothetical protein